mgnify:CR=1 FL=1
MKTQNPSHSHHSMSPIMTSFNQLLSFYSSIMKLINQSPFSFLPMKPSQPNIPKKGINTDIELLPIQSKEKPVPSFSAASSKNTPKNNSSLTLEDHMALTLMISLTTLLLEKAGDINYLTPSFNQLNNNLYRKSIDTLKHHTDYHPFFDQYQKACERYLKIHHQHGTMIKHPLPGLMA